MLGKMWQRVQGLFSPRVSEAEVHARLDKLREQTPGAGLLAVRQDAERQDLASSST